MLFAGGPRHKDAESVGDQCGRYGGRAAVHHVGRVADVRRVGQPGGQAPGRGGQGADIAALARGQRTTAGVAASTQLRLVDGRGAARRVGGRSTERDHRPAVRRAGRDRVVRGQAPSAGRRASRDRHGRIVRARVQRALLRWLCGGRARAVHA